MTKMITQLCLATTMEEFDKLHAQCDGPRDDVKTVFVDRTALRHLLYDHSQLWGCLEEEGPHIDLQLVGGDRDAQEEASLALKQYRDIKIEKVSEQNQSFVTHNSPLDDSANMEYNKDETNNEEFVTENDESAQT